MNWLVSNADLVLELTLVQMWLSLVPLVVAFVLSVPLGWVAYRYRLAGKVIVPTTVLLYTIPSLPLLIFLPAILGTSLLDPLNLVVALTLYSISLLVSQIVGGLTNVDHDLRLAGEALGFSRWQSFWKVELPSAGPVILAGLRVASVSTISLVSVGSLIGVSSLGYLFLNGFKRGIPEEVATGIVMTIVVALIFDLALVVSGKILMPWTTKGRRA